MPDHAPPLANEDNARLRAMDVAHHLPAQADWGAIAANGGSRIIVSAEGCRFRDAEGREYLDGMAGLWCVSVGYGRPELAQAAAEQMNRLAYYNTFFRTATPPTVELAARLAGKLGGDLRHVFFNSSGSEAMDTVIRLVRHYWASMGRPWRSHFIARRNGYHGSTVGSASLGGMAAMHAQGGLPIPGISHIRQPYAFNEAEGMDDEAFAEACAQALEAEIMRVGPDNVAAFVAEPVQGAGGVIIPPPGYWHRIEAICRRYGILLVADEVICGFGRTGRWFGHQTLGFTPDIVTMAKGITSGYLPLSAVAVSARLVEDLRVRGGDFVHGYTYSGHPVCAAVALANIDILERENLPGRVASIAGPALADALSELGDHPLVGEVRSIGLLGAVEIVAERTTRRRFGGKEGKAGPIVRDHCIERGLMVRAIRDTIAMCPPLVIGTDDIRTMVRIVGEALDAATPALRALDA
jgi:putrescine aminotransferase